MRLIQIMLVHRPTTHVLPPTFKDKMKGDLRNFSYKYRKSWAKAIKSTCTLRGKMISIHRAQSYYDRMHRKVIRLVTFTNVTDKNIILQNTI